MNKRRINENVIKDLQNQLNKLVAKHGCNNLLHPEVLEFSQLLDEYIVAYTRQSNQC
ncbi:MAG: aspartyl-phosphate phosphatase Spo0E family protein [Clostridia bacterium]|nr:aspartyl-phosphate phosphatase Spo0E family protein [Clostridia bacterium]MDD4680349.1 aspartyl-phosphate phosphatase Spo0E family protein [Clostridia bacterium]